MKNYLIGLTAFFVVIASTCTPEVETKKENNIMRQYINAIDGERLGTTFDQKCQALKHFGAVESEGEKFERDLVCVVDNGPFAAIGYAFNSAEYEEFKSPCGRRKQWFTLENAAKHAE